MKSALDIPTCHPERFNRGSSPKFAWIPAKSMREWRNWDRQP